MPDGRRVLGSEGRQPALSLVHHILDEMRDDPADQFMDAARQIEAGIELRRSRAATSSRNGDLAQRLDVEEPCPQAVIDIVGVIGNVVGDGRSLRLAARMGRQFQVLQIALYSRIASGTPRAA